MKQQAYFDLKDLIGVTKIEGIGNPTSFWLSTVIHNYKNEANNPTYEWSNVLSKEELKDLTATRKEILGKDELGKKVTVFRTGIKIFVIKKFNDGIRKKRII